MKTKISLKTANNFNKRNSNILVITAIAVVISTVSLSSNSLAGVGGYGYNSGGGGIYGIAKREIVRRKEMMTLARQKIIEGDQYYKDKDYEQAVRSYREAVDLLPPAQVSYELRQAAIQRFAKASVKLARQRAEEGNYEAAISLAEAVLQPNIDPTNKEARKLLKDLQDPEVYSPALTPELTSRIQNVERLLMLAHSNYELGNFDEATNKYYEVLNNDKYNKAARRGMERVNQEQSKYYDAAYTQTRAELLRDVSKSWELPYPKSGLRGADAEANRITNVSGKSKIQSKLKQIVFPKIEFDGTPIEEAVLYLTQRSKQLDPEGRGVDIILDIRGGGGEANTEPITLTMENVPMDEALHYTTRIARLKYKVEDRAIVILPATEYRESFVNRSFRVPPSFFNSGTGGAAEADDDPFAIGADTGGGSTTGGRRSAKETLAERGISFPEGSTAYYNPQNSTLLVRNTERNMEAIEILLQEVVDIIPKQIYISTKFIEIGQENLDELGYDWLIGPFNVYTSDRVFGSGGTIGNQRNSIDNNDFPIVPSGTGRTPVGSNLVTSGLRSGDLANSAAALDSLLTQQVGVSSLAPAIGSFAGVFTDPQFQVVIRALNQKRGTDLLSAPSVTAKSGQSAKIEVIREMMYPTEYDPPQIPDRFLGDAAVTFGGLGGSSSAVNSFPVTPANPTTFETKNIGITLEVNPQIGPDGYTIDMTLTPQTVEFEGFINYGTPINSSGIDALGNPTTITLTENEINMPVFALRRLNTQVTIWDGHTLALGGLIREDVSHTQDRVPLLGSLPLVGRLFRSESKRHIKKNLIIFVSGKIIDASGQPINKLKAELSQTSQQNANSEFSQSLGEAESILFQ